ncbi:Uncharacterised protein [Mycobacteroides abscessus subsp. abscessus]|nr:Uncharacterised protein [Mycobacteroides abscessus subsp. abscessus]SLB68093.1 Uncharacterised protein [Mycobacteroides abscessus subsp. abscessus]
MPQDNQWNYEDGVVPGGTICRADDHATALDAQTRKALRNLTSPTVENPRFISPTCSCGCPHCC